MLLLVTFVFAQGSDLSETVSGNLSSYQSLGQYLAYAAENSPDLRSSYYSWQAQSAQADQGDDLPDPSLVFTKYIENVETRVGPQNWAVSLQQPIPWPGKLSSRHKIAKSAASAAYMQLEATRLRLFYRVKAAYYDYYLLAREIEITDKQIELLRYWESVVRVRYETAIASHADLIESQIELATLEDRRQSLDSRLRPAAARLRAAASLPDSLSLSSPAGIPLTTPDLSADALFDLAVQNNPDLGAVDALIDKEKANLSLAGRSYYPDFHLGLNYISTGAAMNPSTPESGKDPWTISVGITLPIWFGNKSSRKSEARSRLRSQEYRRDETINNLRDRIENTSWEYHDAIRRTRFIADNLLSKTEQSLNVTFASYQAGGADFLQLMETQRKFFELELIVEQQKVRGQLRLAELEMLTGNDLAGLEPSNKYEPKE